jgi:RNA polymerase sigma-70 factor (ECF subfamily)
MDEADVLERIQDALDGEPERFAPLVHAYSPGLFNLAAKMTGSRDHATEIVQETFFRAYRDLGRFDGRSRFQSWLYGICVNVCHDAGKRRKRAAMHGQEALESLSDTAAGADDSLAARQEEARMRRCLERLPETLRAAVLLRFHEDMALGEVAKSLGIGLSAAKMRVARGLGQLRACMEGRE